MTDNAMRGEESKAHINTDRRLIHPTTVLQQNAQNALQSLAVRDFSAGFLLDFQNPFRAHQGRT